MSVKRAFLELFRL